MRLERFSIQKYRSIIKAEKLPLGDLTVLVGPNNLDLAVSTAPRGGRGAETAAGALQISLLLLKAQK